MKTIDRIFLKTTFIISIFLLFSTVILYNSCDKPRNEDNIITQNDIDSMKENHIIPLNDAVKMYKKYSKDRVDLLKDTLKEKYKDKSFKDTRTVWFDMKTIKAYIKHVEDESDKVGVQPEGLQFYFGVNKYKEDEEYKQKNHQTFFIAPTKKDGTIQSGYTLQDKGGKQQVVFIHEAINRSEQNYNEQNMKKASFFTSLANDENLTLNGGTDSPPNGNN